MSDIDSDEKKITVYKVCVPSYYAWPPGNIILKVCYTKKEAENYVESYPNPFVKLWLTIESDVLRYEDTD